MTVLIILFDFHFIVLLAFSNMETISCLDSYCSACCAMWHLFYALSRHMVSTLDFRFLNYLFLLYFLPDASIVVICCCRKLIPGSVDIVLSPIEL